MIRFRLHPAPPARTAAMNQLMLARRRAQPAAAYIARMTLTAVAAYLIALELPGTARPVLAPLTALLVLQASFFQTVRSAVTKVAGVTAGVLTAVAVAAYVPFSWWVLGLLIAGTLALGMVLTPGPNMIYLISRSITQGPAAGIVSLGGVALGFVFYMLCAAFGITALLFAVPFAYDALRLAGAAYLLWLAWQALKPGGRSPFQVKKLKIDGPRKLFAMGFVTGLPSADQMCSGTIGV